MKKPSTFDDALPIHVIGHLKIEDEDLGTVLVDKFNAVHPQNLARVFARALANEHNYYINRIAFGNGGTTIDTALTVTYNPPNDGQYPDVATWDSRIYHETYSEIVDEGQVTLNPLLGTDPGSADNSTGLRTGGGAVPAGDPASLPHVPGGSGVRSTELGLLSEVKIVAMLNSSEPNTQYMSDSNATLSGDFTFDEIGLYTGGTHAIATGGYQYIDVRNKTSTDITGFIPGQYYTFLVTINNGATAAGVQFLAPHAGGSGPNNEILFGDFCEGINTGSPDWGHGGNGSPIPGGGTLSITDLTNGTFPSIQGVNTFGYLKIESGSTGASSNISLPDDANNQPFLLALNAPVGATLVSPVTGTDAGVRNSPTTPETERERLLAHLTFSPVLKAANRTLRITYTLTIAVARTPTA